MMKLLRSNHYWLISYRSSSSSAANQLSRAMNKLSSNKKSKQKWYSNQFDQPILSPVVATSKEKNQLGKQGQRRINVINKLCMRYITDIMATGDMADELLGKGIEISRVKVTPDFNVVNVYWTVIENNDDDEVVKLLKKAAGYVKHELSNLRVLGLVPHITFVKDEKLAKLAEVQKILSQINLVQENNKYVMNIGSNLKEDQRLNLDLEDHIVEKIKKLDDTEQIDEEELPAMKHDVFGLDQLSISNRIKEDMSMVKKAWETYEVKSDLTCKKPVELSLEKRSEEVETLFKQYVQRSLADNKRSRVKGKKTPALIIEEYDEPDNFVDGDFLEEETEINK